MNNTKMSTSSADTTKTPPHQSSNLTRKNFLQQCRRYNYTTPTSFLELISFYKALLGSKTDRISE